MGSPLFKQDSKFQVGGLVLQQWPLTQWTCFGSGPNWLNSSLCPSSNAGGERADFVNFITNLLAKGTSICRLSQVFSLEDMAYLPLHRFVAYVRSVSLSLHTFAASALKFHWISCVSLLTASITLSKSG